MKKTYLFIIAMVLMVNLSYGQWLTTNQLSDLNSWSSQAGPIGWYGTAINTPTSMIYGSGIQTLLPQDTRFGSQIVLPTFDNQMFYRQNSAGSWSSWYTVWSSANFDPDSYLDRSLPSIGNSGTANSFNNGYTFAYAGSGTPWNGSLISYGGFGGSYDTQISSDYGPNGGNHISFRTKNGDNQTWNGWYEFYHSGNMNKPDVDFTARTVTSTNVYANGNIWAKQIVVSMTNPWPDFVFRPGYRLPALDGVKDFIKKNHHLPNVPSEAEIRKDGINLGEIVKLQTQKIEELTLYLIDQQKEMEQLKRQVSTLTKAVTKN